MSNKPKYLKPAPQQQPFDVSEAVPKNCEQCGGKVFDLAFKLMVISHLSPKNNTGQDVLVKAEAFLCHECGHEFGQVVETKDQGDS